MDNYNDNRLDSHEEPTQDALPATYAAPEVHELGNCSELTLGSCCFFSESDGRWC